MKNSINRYIIIQEIEKEFIDNPKVYAYWLEGADGLDKVDEYSDIDIVLDVEDGFESDIFIATERVLLNLGELDVNYKVNHQHPKIHQKLYHIKNSNEYLIIDFCIQSHSRPQSESTFVKGDILEFPKIIFDKYNVITIVEQQEEYNIEILKERVEELISRYKQHSRVIKYVERGTFAEAFMYYMKYVADPLVELARIQYTPKYFYLHMIHISDHIPKRVVEELENSTRLVVLKTSEIRR